GPKAARNCYFAVESTSRTAGGSLKNYRNSEPTQGILQGNAPITMLRLSARASPVAQPRSYLVAMGVRWCSSNAPKTLRPRKNCARYIQAERQSERLAVADLV